MSRLSITEAGEEYFAKRGLVNRRIAEFMGWVYHTRFEEKPDHFADQIGPFYLRERRLPFTVHQYLSRAGFEAANYHTMVQLMHKLYGIYEIVGIVDEHTPYSIVDEIVREYVIVEPGKMVGAEVTCWCIYQLLVEKPDIYRMGVAVPDIESYRLKKFFSTFSGDELRRL